MAESPKSRKRKRKKHKRHTAGRILAVLLLCVFAAGLYRGWLLFGPNREVISEEELFGVRGDTAAVFYRSQLQKAEGIVSGGEYYLPQDWVQAILNQRFYWDDDEDVLVYALPEEILEFRAGDEDRKGRPYLITRDQKTYLSASLIKSHTDVRIEGYTGESARIFAEETPEQDETAEVRKKGMLRASPGLRGRVIRPLVPGETVRRIPVRSGMEPDPRWIRVMTLSDGFTGYIYDKNMSEFRETQVENSFSPEVYSHLRQETPVVLGWHQVTLQAANQYLDSLTEHAACLNVISPTWYGLRGNDGTFEDLSSASYVKKAHEKGMQVWALLDNLDQSVTLGTLLKKTSVRKKLIQDLTDSARASGADGINVDFELLRKDASRQYLEFIRELSAACRILGLVLSVDVPNPASYNQHYDRRELAEVCDYVINMGYDEHTAGDEPGSTSSIGFFRQGLADSLSEMEPEALIGGVPFYTRVWTVKNGSAESRALTMQGALNWLEENDAGLSWDSAEGQYISEKERPDGTRLLLWMEEERSMELKLNALKESGAAGVACWRLGTQTDDMWELIQKIIAGGSP